MDDALLLGQCTGAVLCGRYPPPNTPSNNQFVWEDPLAVEFKVSVVVKMISRTYDTAHGLLVLLSSPDSVHLIVNGVVMPCPYGAVIRFPPAHWEASDRVVRPAWTIPFSRPGHGNRVYGALTAQRVLGVFPHEYLLLSPNFGSVDMCKDRTMQQQQQQ
ncbi:unnamed protein product [Schistocephalus solidus]|uniref:SPRY domain-containing protein n=1 Tax=Schistocephalus solidus TaxID=70667 RepID=A0A183SV79_SCHSO|nr:unnamed protein product [Schistocephalus solidus]